MGSTLRKPEWMHRDSTGHLENKHVVSPLQGFPVSADSFGFFAQTGLDFCVSFKASHKVSLHSQPACLFLGFRSPAVLET